MILTVGHSTLPEEDFVSLLRKYNVDTLCDIRSHPTSRWPQFWRESMAEYLRAAGVGYVWEPRLGGWQKKDMKWAPLMAQYGVDLREYAKGFFPKQRIARSVPVGTRLDPKCQLHGCPEAIFTPGLEKRRCTCDKKANDPTPIWVSIGLRDMAYNLALSEAVDAIHDLIERGGNENVAICCAEATWWRCHRSLVSDMLVFFGADAVHIPGTKPHSACLGNRLERYESAIIEAWKSGGMQL